MKTGLCKCGCGQTTNVAKCDRPMKGIKKGDHYQYIAGHHPHGFPRGHQVNNGRILSNEHKDKIRAGLERAKAEGKAIGHPPGMTTWNKGISIDTSHLHTKEVWNKISIANTGKSMSEETKNKLSKIVKEWWKIPGNAKKCLAFNSPNKQELKLMGILDDMYPGEWKFVGDGQVIINGKCPDFMNVNGQKQIIELYGERWHKNDDPEKRKEVFTPYGYRTLVLWVRELQCSRSVKTTIRRFCESRQTGGL